MKKISKVILGSGLSSLICKRALGESASIIPLGPSRFYSSGVPGWGDDFVTYDESIADIFKDWGLNISPLLYKRPLSFAGELTYGDQFKINYLERIGLSSHPIANSYFKTNFSVFSFSCIQLWSKLIGTSISDIKSFYNCHKDVKRIISIKDHIITFNNGDTIEYDKLISTVPYYVLCKYLGIEDTNRYQDVYYYFIGDSNINIDNADQVLVCDPNIPFHKCTKISNSTFLFEIIGEYYEDIYNILSSIIGNSFEIIKANLVQSGHVLPGSVNNNILKENDIVCIGSYAQCDPLIDIGAVLKRLKNLMLKNLI